MPCSCFGKKDKKLLVLEEEDRYRPREDSRERDPLSAAPAPISVAPITPTSTTQSQSQPLLGAAPPPATATPPSTPLATPTTPGGEARLRPEDDPDKATRRRDVVASFCSDECELIGFKATGSRPPSAHVGSIQDGPAATSSPTPSSPSSTRSGAFCRADLAEKRREFFRELNADDEELNGSRPTSRLTDPGSQQTPRHSSYQDQLHHTLPHQNKSNKLASNPFMVQEALNKDKSISPPLSPTLHPAAAMIQQAINKETVSSSASPTATIIQQALIKRKSRTAATDVSSEDTEPLLPSHSSPQQAPKKSPKKADRSVPKIPNILSRSNKVTSHINDVDSEDTPLLYEKETPSETQLLMESSFATTVQQVSPEISPKSMDQSPPESIQILDVSEVNSPQLFVDMSPTENSKLVTDTTHLKQSEFNVVFPTEPTEYSKFVVDTSSVEISELIDDKSLTENSKLIEDFLSKNNSQVSVDVSASNHSPQLIVDLPNTESEQLLVNMSVQESPQNVDHITVDPVLDNTPLIFSSTPKVETFIQQDLQTPAVESFSVESPQSFSVESPQSYSVETPPSIDKQFDIVFSHEPFPQTLPVIINETLKEPHKESYKEQLEHMTFVVTPHKEQSEHTTFDIMPHKEQSEDMTFEITPPNTHLFSMDSLEDQTPQTIVETTRQFISGSPDEQKTSQTIVETTRQFITGPAEEQTTKTVVETTQQYISGSPEEPKTTQTIVETTRQFISGIPEGEETQKLMESAQQFFSGTPDDQTTQTIVFSGTPDEQTTQTVVFSGSPDEQTMHTIVKTTQQFVSGSPDEELTQTIVQTQQFVSSSSPDEQITQTTTVESTQQSLPPSVDPFFLTSAEEPDELPEKLLLQSAAPTITQQTGEKPVPMPRVQFTEVETLEEEYEEPKLPDVPCFGAPPPPASPPPPLPEDHESMEPAVIFPHAVDIPPGEVEPLPPAPPTPPAEQEVQQPQPTAPLLEQQEVVQFETDSLPHTPPKPSITHGDNEDLPPAPPTPPMPRLDNVHLPSTPPIENELLPPTPPTPHREDELPPAPPTPPKENKLLPSTPPKPSAPTTLSSSPHREDELPPAPPTPPKENKLSPSTPPKPSAPTTLSSSPPVTCGVQIVSKSSTLEDDGIGSEIDDALESLEGLSEEGKIERAAASS